MASLNGMDSIDTVADQHYHTNGSSTAASTPKGRPIATYNVELPDKLARLIGKSKEEVEARLVQDVILSLLAQGDLDVQEAAQLLNCEPDDLLTPEHETQLAKGAQDFARGEHADWDDVKQQLKL